MMRRRDVDSTPHMRDFMICCRRQPTPLLAAKRRSRRGDGRDENLKMRVVRYNRRAPWRIL